MVNNVHKEGLAMNNLGLLPDAIDQSSAILSNLIADEYALFLNILNCH